MKFPLGIMADSLRLPIWDAVIKSAELGANGVQIYAVGGEFCFENIPDTKRSQYKSLLGDLGISISALCGDFGGHGFQIPADNPKRLRESRKVMDLAVSLDCKVVTTHIGAIPHDRNSERYAILHEAATKLGAIGESYGIVVLASIIGLIPNCAVSVALTELYVGGMLGEGALISGLLVGAGVGLLTLFRANKKFFENVKIAFLLWAIGLAVGCLVKALGISFM